MSEKWKERIITGVFCIGLFFVLTTLGTTGEIFGTIVGIIAPVVYGGFVALILGVFMSGITNLLNKIDRRRRLPEKLKILLSMLLTFAAIILVFYVLIIIIVPRFSESVQSIIKTVENNWSSIVEFCNKLGLDASNLKNLISKIDTASIIGFAGENVKNILSTAVSTVSSLYGAVFTGVISVVCCIYILYGQKKLSSQATRVIRAYFPTRAAEWIISTARLFWDTFKNFLSRQCLEAVILGTLLMIAMLIFRVPYALLVGCMTALLALIPYVGAFISFVVGAVLILLATPSKVIVFAILFLVIQQIEGNIIYPHIVGKSVGLPAIWTLMAVYVGGELFGVVGMFISVPIISVIYTLISQDVARRNKIKQIKAE